jgi:hypothetical protein
MFYFSSSAHHACCGHSFGCDAVEVWDVVSSSLSTRRYLPLALLPASSLLPFLFCVACHRCLQHCNWLFFFHISHKQKKTSEHHRAFAQIQKKLDVFFFVACVLLLKINLVFGVVGCKRCCPTVQSRLRCAETSTAASIEHTQKALPQKNKTECSTTAVQTPT